MRLAETRPYSQPYSQPYSNRVGQDPDASQRIGTLEKAFSRAAYRSAEAAPARHAVPPTARASGAYWTFAITKQSWPGCTLAPTRTATSAYAGPSR